MKRLEKIDVGDTLANLWDNGQHDDFHRVRAVIKQYRNVGLYRYGAKLVYASALVNLMPIVQARVEFAPHPIPEAAPALLWVSMFDRGLNQKIYSDPPSFELGCRNPSGFGVVPKPGWEGELRAMGCSKSIIKFAQSFLDEHPPLEYM